MSAFRKLAFALTAGALTVSMAMAQNPLPLVGGVPGQFTNQPPGVAGALVVAPNVPITTTTCNTTANPLTVRSEGYSELMGDVILSCNGTLQVNTRNFVNSGANPVVGTLTRPIIPVVNISVTLSTPVTNKLVGGNSMTDALLFLSDENSQFPLNPAGGTSQQNQNPCPTLYVNGNGNCAYPGSGAVFVPADTIPNEDTVVGSGPTVANSRPTAAILATAGLAPISQNPINVYQGQLQNNNTVVFLGVPLAQYDSSNNPNISEALYNIIRTQFAGNAPAYDGRPITAPFQKRLVIKNLRGAIPGAAANNGQVFGFLSIQNPPANLQVNSASPVVGFVQDGINFRLRTLNGVDGYTAPRGYVVCEDINRNLAVDATATSLGSTATTHVTGRFDELYANSFKIRGFAPGQLAANDQNNPSITYNTESGFYNTTWSVLPNGIGRAGIADQGTRLRMFFNNNQANTRIYVSAAGVAANSSVAGGGGGTTFTLGAYGVVSDASGTNISPITTPVIPTSTAGFGAGFPSSNAALGGTALVPAIPANSNIAATGLTLTNGWVQVSIPTSGGSGSFTWEVYSADPNNPEWIAFAIIHAYRASNNPALGTSTVQGSFAPVNTTATASSTAPVPRFADRSTALSLFNISTCITNILFPFVSNIAPFDTGIAISNTSLSNPGTGEILPNAPATQQGACSINYFGYTGTGRGAAPAPATSGVIPPGQTLTFTLLSGGGAPFGNIPATPGFQGYIIAQCAFRYAHGYAFISDIGATQLAHGYLALILDAGIASRGAFSETLGH